MFFLSSSLKQFDVLWFYIHLILFTETSVYIKSHAIKYRKLHKYIDYLLGCHPHLHNQQFIDMHICIYTLLVLTLLRKHGKHLHTFAKESIRQDKQNAEICLYQRIITTIPNCSQGKSSRKVCASSGKYTWKCFAIIVSPTGCWE